MLICFSLIIENAQKGFYQKIEGFSILISLFKQL